MRSDSGGSATSPPIVRRTRSGRMFASDPESAVRWVQAATSVPIAHEYLGGAEYVHDHKKQVAAAVASAFDEKLQTRRAQGGADPRTTECFVQEALVAGDAMLRQMGAPSDEELERAAQAKLVEVSNAAPAAQAQRRSSFA